MSTNHYMIKIEFVPADGRGSIDGWAATCSCGAVYDSSFQSWAKRAVIDHATWMSSEERRAFKQREARRWAML